MAINSQPENWPKMVGKPVSEDKNNYIGKKTLWHHVEVHRMKRRSFMAVLLLTLTMFSAMLVLIPEESEASQLTIVTISVQATPPEVDVSPGSPGIVVMNGEVRCTKYGPDPVEVYLIAASDTGGASVVPPNFVFSGSTGTTQTDTFAVTTRVPMGYTFMATPQITVSGTYSQGALSYTIPPVMQIIKILPYYKLELETPPPQEIGPGEFVYFPIKITNVGNAEDTYRFDFINLEDLTKDQWTVAPITDKTLPEDEMQQVTVTAQAPQTWTIWRNDVTPLLLRVTSIQSEETAYIVKYDIPLYVRQKGIYIPGFSPMFAILGIGVVALIMGKRRMSLG
jgi:hypothetical protein